MLSRLIQALQTRFRWAQIGIYFLRSSGLKADRLTIAEKKIALRIPESERGLHLYDLHQIYLGDCYGLRKLRKVKTIVDIGANIGLFSMIARHYFPEAHIHAYEPNPALRETLARHLGTLGVQLHFEAVGRSDGRVSLVDGASSQSIRTAENPAGDLPMVGIQTVVNRMGCTIDLLKMDCEGAEWDILSDGSALRDVTTLVMEYHLTGAPSETLDHLVSLLKSQGFQRVEIQQRLDESWGMLQATRGV